MTVYVVTDRYGRHLEVLSQRPQWDWDADDQRCYVANVNGGDSERIFSQLRATSPELHEALSREVGKVFGREEILVGAYNSGGDMMVCTIDLSIDGRGSGRQLWLSREESWYLGFYDYSESGEDEGVCVDLGGYGVNDPDHIAKTVAGILRRLGVNKLQGE